MFLKFQITLIFAFILTLIGKSQFSDNSEVIEKFNFEIIQIEEFMDRFNFDKDTKFLKYIDKTYPDFSFPRKDFLLTLFDSVGNIRTDSLITEFIGDICDTATPIFLNFYNNNWYAEVSCIFEFENSTDTGNLVLMNQIYPDSSSKWVIIGVNSKILDFPKSRDSLQIMSPVSHGTNFITLYNVFKDGKNIQNYVTKNFQVDKMTYFITLMYFNKIKINQVFEVKYHFLQVPNWTFTVEYFNRKELKSGWLISSLFKMTDREKFIYKKDIYAHNIYYTKAHKSDKKNFTLSEKHLKKVGGNFTAFISSIFSLKTNISYSELLFSHKESQCFNNFYTSLLLRGPPSL